MTPDDGRFSALFDRALDATAVAQHLASECAETAHRARELRAAALRSRVLAVATRTAWTEAATANELLRHEVTQIAIAMRASGVARDEAAAAMRAHVRFVLYEGGLTERDAEPVVERTSDWVEVVYEEAA